MQTHVAEFLIRGAGVTVTPAAYAHGVRGFFVEQEAPYEKPRLEAIKISCDYLNSAV